jgi:hypothetical protein
MQSGAKRGKDAEERAQRILRTLADVLPIQSVECATQRQDSKGVDLTVVLTLSGREVRVPVQVKSSESSACSYRKKYPTYVPIHRVILVVVNEKKTDEDLSSELKEALTAIIKDKITFDAFFEQIESPTNAANVIPLRRKMQPFLAEAPILGRRKKVKYIRFIPAFY